MQDQDGWVKSACCAWRASTKWVQATLRAATVQQASTLLPRVQLRHLYALHAMQGSIQTLLEPKMCLHAHPALQARGQQREALHHQTALMYALLDTQGHLAAAKNAQRPSTRLQREQRNAHHVQQIQIVQQAAPCVRVTQASWGRMEGHVRSVCQASTKQGLGMRRALTVKQENILQRWVRQPRAHAWRALHIQTRLRGALLPRAVCALRASQGPMAAHVWDAWRASTKPWLGTLLALPV
jgi:hypothetical protein